MQKTIDQSNRHRIQYMKALENASKNGDITQWKAKELRKGYDD